MDQQTFLKLAKRELGLTYPQLAEELGVGVRTIEKWSLHARSADHRAMPAIAERFICKLLEDKKRASLAVGDRSRAEVIDAIVCQVSPRKLAESLRTLDALQATAAALAPLRNEPDKPRYFRTQAEKDVWQAEEEVRHARRVQQASAIA